MVSTTQFIWDKFLNTCFGYIIDLVIQATRLFLWLLLPLIRERCHRIVVPSG